MGSYWCRASDVVSSTGSEKPSHMSQFLKKGLTAAPGSSRAMARGTWATG